MSAEEDEEEEDESDQVLVSSSRASVEECRFGSDYLGIPSGYLSNPSLLDDLLSKSSWNCLPSWTQEHLKSFLPTFPQRDAQEKEVTLHMLFESSNFKFGNPLDQFKRKLLSGSFHPDRVRLQRILSRARRRQASQGEKERKFLLLQSLLSERKKILESRLGTSISTPLSVLKMEKKSIKTGPDIDYRARKRYHRELRLIRSAAGQSGDSSEDEGSPPLKSLKKKEINLLDSDYWKTVVQNESMLDSRTSPSETTQSRLSKRGRPPKKEFLLYSPTLNNMNKVSSLEKSSTFSSLFPSQPMQTPSPIMEETVASHIPDSLLSPELLLPTTPLKPDELPPHSGLTPPPPPEVVVMSPPPQEVIHSQSYFSLLRDIFLCHPDFKITIPSLEEAVGNWQRISADNPPNWFSWADCWVAQIPSAVAFLTGAFPDSQPKDFSPFIDCDPVTGNYEWTGSGRDADVDLIILKQWWFERRDVCRAITTGGGSLPPEAVFNQIQQNISFPLQTQDDTSVSFTDWTVRPSTDEEKAMYRIQEHSRYSNPGKAFTYHIHGYSTTVGPIRGVGNFPSKAKVHVLLVGDRPSCITILCLVKDAVARLPNGEGTRPDIVELIKDSQYINPNADPQVLTSAVSGALDRLQSEADPCVKYESIKKTWSYLHRGRSEEEFMRIYNEQLSLPKSALKPKRPKSRRQHLTFPNSSAIAASTPKGQSTLPSKSVLETVVLPHEPTKDLLSDNMLMNSVQALLPQVPLPPSPPPSNHSLGDQIQLHQALSNSSLSPESVSVQQKQTVQLMTPDGLKTYQFSIPVQSPSNSVNSSSQTLVPTSTATLLKQIPHSVLLDQSGNRINNVNSGGKTVVYNYQKSSIPIATMKKGGVVRIGAPNSNQSILFNKKSEKQETNIGEVRISVPSPHSGHRQTVQRVIVKNSEGKPVQLTAASLQKLLSSGALKSSLQLALGNSNKTLNRKIPTSESIVVQQQQQQPHQPVFRLTPQRFSQVLSSSNLKSQTLQGGGVRYVQLRSPLNSSGNPPNVRILSTSNHRPSPIRLASNTKVLSLPSQQQQQQVLSTSNSLSRTVKVPYSSYNPFTSQRVGTIEDQSILTSSSKSQVVQMTQGGNVVSTTNQHTRQLLIQSSPNEKPIVLSHQALQNAKISNFQNVRIVQSHHQSSISPDGKILTRIIHPGSTSE